MTRALARLISVLWSGESAFVTPLALREIFQQAAPQFADDEQHDANEALGALLDLMHDDLNVADASKARMSPAPTDMDIARERSLSVIEAARIEWTRYRLRNESAISIWMGGQERSVIACQTCRHSSATFSPWLYLSLPLPPQTRPLTLIDCFQVRWHVQRRAMPHRQSGSACWLSVA